MIRVQYITPMAKYKKKIAGDGPDAPQKAPRCRGAGMDELVYLRTNSTPRVPGPQWQETVQPASVS